MGNKQSKKTASSENVTEKTKEQTKASSSSDTSSKPNVKRGFSNLVLKVVKTTQAEKEEKKDIVKENEAEMNLKQKRRQRLVRVFVSSTFLDFQPDRNVLAKEVFPKVREFCKARGLHFVGFYFCFFIILFIFFFDF
eukprot:Lithocolla_globosa_v1_NODE_4891_length_1343_cov_18.658650.p1 type:complete len:137 gc:universal NODE_4891_length_1343_cov_18.658650:624-214(-)